VFDLDGHKVVLPVAGELQKKYCVGLIMQTRIGPQTLLHNTIHILEYRTRVFGDEVQHGYRLADGEAMQELNTKQLAELLHISDLLSRKITEAQNERITKKD